MLSSMRKCLSFRRFLVLESYSSSSLHRHQCFSPLYILPSPFIHEASRAPDLSATVASAHRVFCSRSSIIDDAQGPAAIDYRSILEEDEFHCVADATINDLQEKLEEYGDSIQIDGFDIDYANQVLTLKLGNSGTYVLNKQTPNRQIWLSSPVSGPSRFDWDRSGQSWIYRRTKANLIQLLEIELEQLCGKPISLS
ncbi:frataxin, mitochondrial [Macadamia integrifolia]|uniref:frataxin, mitochondrial n=1 Tax=Macadamia integrifolia TaxID=60698 RepID=UPI001C52F995|nr:frataxin, mitochondrial [Macadamia integrifolia]XP_042521104.1 frataxin, mitochondrial [Macadamia integrifolia]XP_042521105.1 frataxin, mitochondrial [Macadamia integrifolia]XP_042521106.1 frataxin, mitochondrial [Macadamia integrifolia]XP_042521107.1 frataxin, mitochondrial [Macadamia integrifolia]